MVATSETLVSWEMKMREEFYEGENKLFHNEIVIATRQTERSWLALSVVYLSLLKNDIFCLIPLLIYHSQEMCV